MEKRNKFLEEDGLYATTDTHEWFNDNVSTSYAHRVDLSNVALKKN